MTANTKEDPSPAGSETGIELSSRFQAADSMDPIMRHAGNDGEEDDGGGASRMGTMEQIHLSSDDLVPDEDQSPVENDELKGFYAYGFAAEGYAALGSALFMPLIIETMAANSSVENSDKVTPCNTTVENYSCSVHVGGAYIGPTSFFFYCTVIATLAQLLLFVSMGSFADYGGYRKKFLVGFGLATAIINALFITVVRDSLYWYGALIFIFSNVSYGASYVFCYAYVPILARNHPEVIAVRQSVTNRHELPAVSDRITNHISTRAFFWSYVAAVIELFIGAAIVLVLGDGAKWGLPSVYPLQIAVFLTSIWYIGFMIPTFRKLKSRPGPPLPKGERNFVLFSWKKIGHTIAKARKLSNLFTFLIGWFIFSDAFTTTITVAVLFAHTELKMTNNTLIIVGLLVPLVAGLGCLFWNWFQRRSGWSTRSCLVLLVSLYCILPIWGLIGFFAPFGVKHPVEIFVLGAWHGFLLGASQSFCRSLFSELLPPGYESEFFSLYEVTDRGSTWIGPLVVGAIGDATGNQRYAFFFLIVVFVLPIFIFARVDVAKGKEESRRFVEEEGRMEREKKARLGKI
ncbi:Autophagy protein 22 [Irineochytrium annulatum]|nr:Autophagy protein 22 [Irineochytrium annulatum]